MLNPDAFVGSAVWNDSSEQVEILKLDMPKRKPCLPSVSSALVLGAFLGLGEALILAILAGPILTVMGIDSVSLSFYILPFYI